MQYNLKAGNNHYEDEPLFLRRWRDGALIDKRQDGYYNNCKSSTILNCIIQDDVDYWDLRGSHNWKYTSNKIYTLKKQLVAADSTGRYEWEPEGIKLQKRSRKRDWFADFAELLKLKLITKDQYDSIYRHEETGIVYIPGDFSQYIHHEDGIYKRVYNNLHNQPYSSGVHGIGAAAEDATDWADADSKTAATLTGDMNWQHKNEESSISAAVEFNPNTASHTFTCEPKPGAEHDGGAYGNGARTTMGTSDRIEFDEATTDTLKNFVFHKLAFDASGSGNIGVLLRDGSPTSGVWLLNRLLVKTDSNTTSGIEQHQDAGGAGNLNHLRNCTVYGGAANGIIVSTRYADTVLYNCTSIKNVVNIFQAGGGDSGGSLIMKNNLAQDPGTSDYSDTGFGWGTKAKNYGENDSPDSLTENFHDGTSNFTNYGGDDYTMAIGGDAIATLKAGEDLTGTFTDDIDGDTRLAASFFIGADWISVAVGGNAPTGVLDGPLGGCLAGPI